MDDQNKDNICVVSYNLSKIGFNNAQELRSNYLFDFLSLYLEESNQGISSIVVLDASFVCNLTSKQLELLKLPSRCPYIFTCKSSGSLLSNNYELFWHFKSSETGRPIGRGNVDGCFIELNGSAFTLPFELLETIQSIQLINSCLDKDEKLLHVKRLKEVIPFYSLNDDEQLREINILVVNHFTMDVIDEKNLIIAPCFVEYDDEGLVESLTSSENDNYIKQFNSFSTIKSKSIVNNNKFIVIPAKVKKLLEVVKEANQGQISSRRALFLNPNSYFSEKLGSQFNEEYEDIFVSTPDYVSDRISHIGVWEPKYQVFLPAQGSEWFPKDCIGIRLDNDVIFVKPDNIQLICNKIATAIEKGQEYVEIGDGQKIKANSNAIDIISEASKNNNQAEDSISPLYVPRDESLKVEKIVAIIKDNLDENSFTSSTTQRSVQDKFLPNLLKTKKLFDHQLLSIEWLQDSWISGKRGVLLADDMGLGKTLQVLSFLAWLKELEHKSKLSTAPILIVGPTGLLKNWQDEHSKHLEAPGLGKVFEAFGSSLARIRNENLKIAIDTLQNSAWVLTTYDSLALYENIFRRVAWRVIVFDECQSIKNPSSFKTDMSKAMAADFSIGVTGTPVENRLSDLWCITDTMYPGFLGTYKEFKEIYEKDNNNLSDLTSTLKEKFPPPFMLRRMKEDHIPGLPTKKEIILSEPMPPSQKEVYDKILQDISANRYRKKALSALLHMKLVSLAPNLSPEISDDEFIVSSGRLIALFKILDEINNRNEKVLIFLESRALQEKLIPIIDRKYKCNAPVMLINGKTKGAIRQSKVDLFQQLPDGFDAMVISPKAGGTGITLTRANNVIHLDRWWNPAVEDQCSDRVYRIGQDKNVNIYIPMSLYPNDSVHSFDLVLHELLTKKRELSRRVIIPTGFSSSDYKNLFQKATGKEVDDFDDNFYDSKAWLDLRFRILKKYDQRCMLCGATDKESIMHVDHIKPRSKYPQLELDEDNLQVLCEKCNFGKSNKYEDDFREK
jgi:SNF2 family DNA or RNA helicase